MKVELEKSFLMPGAADVAWTLLQDIPGVAACMPGAKITERIDDTHYKGTVTVKLGPASMSFRGAIEVMELDASRRTLHLLGKGSDTAGSSGASMDLVARIEPGEADGSINLVGRSEVTMSGKAAAFGGRMMGTVADQILKQFAGNFAAQVLARTEEGKTSSAGAGSTAGAAGSEVAVGAGTAASSGAAAGAGAAVASAAVSSATAAGGADTSAAETSVADAPNTAAKELNALSLFWAVLRNWFRGLFRRRAA
jgi:carbon monoxide dehydrogenase subunit G